MLAGQATNLSRDYMDTLTLTYPFTAESASGLPPGFRSNV